MDFSKAHYSDISEPTSITEKQFDNVILTNISESTFNALTIKPDKMSAQELRSYATYLSKAIKMQTHTKFFLEKDSVSITYLDYVTDSHTGSFYSNKRRKYRNKNIRRSVAIFFHLLNGLVSHLGVLNTWPPLIAFFPPISALVIGLLLLVQSQRFALLK